MTTRPGRTGRSAAGPLADDGMVTAELAIAIPVLLVVLAAVLGVVGAAATQLRCTDAAAVAARMAARDEPPAAVIAAARRVAPAGARVSLATAPDAVTVTVSAVVRLAVAGRLLPGVTVTERFVAPREPGVTP